MGQPIRNIPDVKVQTVGVYRIPNWQITQPSIPDHNPITNHIGFPVIVKTIRGSYGKGVFLAENKKQLKQ